MQSEHPSLESEQQFRTLADAISQLAWMARADGWIYWRNHRWYEYTGTTPEQMEGWGWESVHDPETLAAVLKRWKKCIATSEPFDMVFPLRGADGVFRQFLTRVQPLKNSEGRVVRWFGTNTNVDELKRAEEKLRESEERYRGIFQHAGTGIAITDLEGRFQSCNPAYTAMLGYTEEELRALVFADLVHPQDREANVAVNRRLLAEEIPSFEIVNRYIRKGGALLWVHKHISLLRDVVGRPFQIIALVTDITARKLAEETLRGHAERQAVLFEITSDLIRAAGPSELSRLTFQRIGPALDADICTNFRLDPEGRRLRLEFESGIPLELTEAVQSLELGQAYCGMAAASRQPIVVDKQRIACDPDGALVRTLGATAYACRPLMASDGRLLGTFAVASRTRESFTDDEVAWFGTVVNFLAQIWERLEAEQGLRASEERLRLAQNAAGLGHWDADFARGTLVWSQQARNLIGVGPAEPASLPLLLSHVHAEDRRKVEQQIARSYSLGSDHVHHAEFRVLTENGALRWLEDQGRVETDAAGKPIRAIGVIRDITDRKYAEQALRASKDRLQLALQAAQLGSWQYDPLRRVFAGDRRSQEIYGVAKNEASVEEIMEQIHPDDAEKVGASLAEAVDPANVGRTVAEYRIRAGVGEVRWVEAHGLAYFEGSGRERRVASVVGTVQDITERKEREEKEYLLMREVNHRAKNMLSVVDAIAHQTAAKNPEDFIERFSERIQALSANQDLLVRNEWKGVDIGDLVHAQLAHFADLIGSRIAVHGPKLRLNPASVQAIGLALHELSTNAAKYGALSTDRGRVDISWGSDDGTLTMSWIEHDGATSPPKRRGFGTIVMEAMTERTVGGEVELDYAPSGVTWRLTCPVANVLERR
jgi:PAS domain S-box-containing protein